MKKPEQEQPPLTLSATWFRAVVDTADGANPDIVQIQMGTIGLGPHFDALTIFGREQTHLIEKLDDSDSCSIAVHVKKENLMRLATEMHEKYNMHIITMGRKPESLISYRNGSVTPCATPLQAMKMAFDHS